MKRDEATPPDETAEEIRTFLIADVRGYTVFTQERGDEAAATLAARFADIVREQVEARDGSVIELRGDEALAVFRSPRQAIRTAVELQARLLQETLATPDLPLPVGIGLDAGEAVQVEGGYRGGALNLASRLCGQAGPGEILCSQSVVHLARAVDGISYVDRGELHLKGLSDPVHVLAIASDGIDVAERMRALAPQAAGAAGVRGERCSSASSGRSRWTRGAARSPSADRSSARSSHICSSERTSSSRPRPWSTRSGAKNRRRRRGTSSRPTSRTSGRPSATTASRATAPGYRLRLDPSELDAARFDALVRDAKKALPVDPHIAIGTLERRPCAVAWAGAGRPRRPALSACRSGPAGRASDSRRRKLGSRGSWQASPRPEPSGSWRPWWLATPCGRACGACSCSPCTARAVRPRPSAPTSGRERSSPMSSGSTPPPRSCGSTSGSWSKTLDSICGESRSAGTGSSRRSTTGLRASLFRAIQPHVERDVTVKVFHEHVASDPAFVRRFEQEAQAAVALEHPHIVPVYDYWREPGRAYLVSRYLRAGSLRGLLERGESLPRDQALRVVEQVAEALAFAHRQGWHTETWDRPTSTSTPRATPTWGTSRSASGRRRTPRPTSGSSPGSPRACCRTRGPSP